MKSCSQTFDMFLIGFQSVFSLTRMVVSLASIHYSHFNFLSFKTNEFQLPIYFYVMNDWERCYHHSETFLRVFVQIIISSFNSSPSLEGFVEINVSSNTLSGRIIQKQKTQPEAKTNKHKQMQYYHARTTSS